MAVRKRARPDALHEQLARRIRELAAANRLSANKLADFSGIGRGYLSDVLNGRKSPTLRILAKIAAALEVDVRDLLPDRRPPANRPR